MILVFSDEEFPNEITSSIFLAGPSPRNQDVYDWRNDAIKLLEEKKYKGVVFIPIPKDVFYGKSILKNINYYNQIKWECQGRAMADIILYWIPRNKILPGLTTNIEFGEDINSGRIVYGRPNDALSCRYLDLRFEEKGLEVCTTLYDTINTSLDLIREGSLRRDGEILVPLLIWNSSQFQNWYQNQKKSGNKLTNFKLKDIICVGKKRDLFYFSAKVGVWIDEEQRYKNNECIFSRNDISSVVASYTNPYNGQRFFVLIKEFRSTVNNNESFVYELPGGSSFEKIDFKENAAKEFEEEVGLKVEDLSRFEYVSSRQNMSTFSTNITHLYGLELTKEEFDIIEGISKQTRTDPAEDDEELTTVIIVEDKELTKYNVDFITLGMISEYVNLKRF